MPDEAGKLVKPTLRMLDCEKPPKKKRKRAA